MNMTTSQYDLVVIGGGAAGYFGAITCAQAQPDARILILEASARVLTKVKISGGGRCNVTHALFETKQLAQYYPRGAKELLGPFHHFQPRDTIDWFSKQGVELKAEADGRMFPVSNNSQTIIDCFNNCVNNCGIILQKNMLVQRIEPIEDGYEIHIKNSAPIKTRTVLLATGSMPYGVSLAEKLGHLIIPPAPSLFTFKIKDPLLQDLCGLSFPSVSLTLKISNARREFTQEGACLITHWGLSGPAVLKLSAFAARELQNSDYHAELIVNWVSPLKTETAFKKLEILKQNAPKKKIMAENPFSCVQRFWEALLRESGVLKNALCGEINKKQLQEIAKHITQTKLQVSGKGEFKEEFVTAGGVARDEIDFRTMQSKLHPGLYFAGEIIDIDGVTGGFNFQNAWTGGWIAGQTISNKLARSC